VTRRLAASFALDNRVFFRSNYYFIQLGIAAIYLVLVLLVVPDDASTKPTLYLADRTTAGDLAGRLTADSALEISTIGKLDVIEGATEIRDRVRSNEGSIGVVVDDNGPESFYFQGSESTRTRNLLIADVTEALAHAQDTATTAATAISPELLNRDQEPITFQKALIPMLLFLDAGMIGMVFIGAVMFNEREDGVLRARMVSPAAVWEYLASKAAALALLALAFGVIFVPVAAGLGPNYPALVALLTVGSISTSLIGAAVAVRFKTFQQFFFPSVVLINVLGLIPAVSYLVPSFSAGWMSLLPTYHFMFAVREATYPSGDMAIIWQAMTVMTAVSVAFMALCMASFKTQLVRR